MAPSMRPSELEVKLSPVARTPPPNDSPSAQFSPRLQERVRAVREMMKVKAKAVDSTDELIDPEQLLQLEALFKAKHNHEMDEKEFVAAFGSVLGGNETDMRGWFKRVDANANGHVDWNEFYNYLLYRHPGTLDNGRAKEYVQGSLKVEKRPTKHHKHFVSKVLVHPRSGAYWTAAHDGAVKIWSPNLRQVHNINNNQHMGPMHHPSKGVMILDMCHGGNGSVMVSSVNKYINVYNNRYQHIRQFAGRKLVNEKKAQHGKILGIEDGVVQREIPTISLLEFEEPATSIYFENDRLLCGLGNGHFHTYNVGRHGHVTSMLVNNIEPSQKVSLHKGAITGLLPVPELGPSNYITGSFDKTIKLVDLELGRVERTLGQGVHRQAICTMDWNPQIKMVVASGPCREVYLWNPFVSSPIAILTGHLTNVVGVAFNAVDKQIISLSSDKCVKVWDLRTMKLFQSFTDASDTVMDDKGYSALAFDYKQNRVVAAGTKLNAWPMRRSLANFETDYKGHTDPLVAVLFTETFNQIVTIDSGGCVQLWNCETGHREYIFLVTSTGAMNGRQGQDDTKDGYAVVCAAFDVFERRLFCGDTRGVISSWNYANGQEIRTIQINDVSQVQHVCSVARVSPSGEAITTGGDTRYVTGSFQEMLYYFSDVGEVGDRVAETYRSAHGCITGLSCNKHAREPILLISTEEGRLVLLNMTTGTEMGVFARGIPRPQQGGGEAFAGLGSAAAGAAAPVTFGGVLSMNLHPSMHASSELRASAVAGQLFLTGVDADKDVTACTCHIGMPQQYMPPLRSNSPPAASFSDTCSNGNSGQHDPSANTNGKKPGGSPHPVGIESMALVRGEFIATVMGSHIIDLYSARSQFLVNSIVSSYTDIGSFVLVRSREDVLVVGDDAGNIHVFDVRIGPCEVHPHVTQGVVGVQTSIFRAHAGSVTSAIVLRGVAHFVPGPESRRCSKESGPPSSRAGSQTPAFFDEPLPKCLIVSCGVDLYVRLHTDSGTLIGCYGSKLWAVRVPSTWAREPVPQALASPRARLNSRPVNLREAAAQEMAEKNAKTLLPRTQSFHVMSPVQAGSAVKGGGGMKRVGSRHITFDEDTIANANAMAARSVGNKNSPRGSDAGGSAAAADNDVGGGVGVASVAPQQKPYTTSGGGAKRRKQQKERRANNRDELLEKGLPPKTFFKGMAIRPQNSRIPNPISDAQRTRTKETIASVFREDGGEGVHGSPIHAAARSASPNVFTFTSPPRERGGAAAGAAAGGGAPVERGGYRLAPLRTTPTRSSSQRGVVRLNSDGEQDEGQEAGANGIPGPRYDGGSVNGGGLSTALNSPFGDMFPDIAVTVSSHALGSYAPPVGGAVGGGGASRGRGSSPVLSEVMAVPVQEPPAQPSSADILAGRICELIKESRENGEGPVQSPIQTTIQQQRQANPKEWTRRAVGLLPLHGSQVGFHKVPHPSSKWSTTIRELAKKKTNPAKDRHIM